MADKQPKLSIVIRTVDQATAKIKAINDRLDAITKPTRDFKKALGELREKSGLDNVIGGFKGVGTAIAGVLSKLAMIGGVAGVAVAGLFSIVDQFDELGDKAEAAGVSVDFLDQMRFAAERSGASVEQLDAGVMTFNKNLGMARAGAGRMVGQLGKLSPALLKQLKGAKSNAEAFDLVADAMAKLEDPGKRAALAQATLGDAALAPLLAKGAAGMKGLRDERLRDAGSMEEAAASAGAVDDTMKKLKSTVDGVKASLMKGFGPALKEIVDRLATWFIEHRADIEVWAMQVGERLPGAIAQVVAWLGKAWDKVTGFVDVVGGLGTVAIAAGVALAGPLVVSLVKLAGFLGSTVLKVLELTGAFGKAADGAAALAKNAASGLGGGGKLVGLAAAAGPVALGLGAAYAINEATGGSIDFGKMEAWAKRKMAGPSLDESVSDALGGRELDDVSLQALGIANGSRGMAAAAKVTVDVNAPRGTRVSTDPQSTADIETNLGLQMEPAL